jgi:endonuclease/exonuclease/phosphatase family metal-dependent hydrolase
MEAARVVGAFDGDVRVADPKTAVTLRVATYNIHKCKGIDGLVRPARVAAIMQVLDADVIAAQEVLASHAELLERHLPGYLLTFGTARKHAGEPYGNATFSRVPVELTANIDLSHGQREPRAVLRTDVRLQQQVVHVFNAHLGTSYFERPHQMRCLLSESALHAADVIGARVLAGDFNEWVRGECSRELMRQFAHVHVRSYPGIAPFMRLDHIYYDHQLRLEQAHVVRTGKALIASDHLPVVAQFRCHPV